MGPGRDKILLSVIVAVIMRLKLDRLGAGSFGTQIFFSGQHSSTAHHLRPSVASVASVSSKPNVSPSAHQPTSYCRVALAQVPLDHSAGGTGHLVRGHHVTYTQDGFLKKYLGAPTVRDSDQHLRQAAAAGCQGGAPVANGGMHRDQWRSCPEQGVGASTSRPRGSHTRLGKVSGQPWKNLYYEQP